MYTDTRKEEMEIPGRQLKAEGSENDVFKSADISLNNNIAEYEDSEKATDLNEFFYSDQFPYNMEGESLW
jgi:hypothetical protein